MTTLRIAFWVCCFLSLLPVLHAAPVQGYVIQWGWNTAAAVAKPARLVFSNAVAVSAGSGHSLALKADGTVVGWGGNYVGNATGVPTTNAPYVSFDQVRIGGQLLTDVISIVADRSFSLALKNNGTVVTWGENYVPKGLTNIAAIAVGWGSSWALKRDGTIVGWVSDPSSHGYGQLLPVEHLSNVAAIAVGPWGYGTRGVALRRDTTVATWGSESIYKEFTTPPASLSNVVAVAAGAAHSLALKRDGTVVGWGSNKVGESTGTATTNSPNGVDFFSAGQVVISGQVLSNVMSIAAGTGYSLALKKDGTVVAWGRMVNDLYPVTVPEGLSDVVAIAAGAEDFCLAITTNRVVADRFRR
jgi:alpha-tubulin suppressor-like RCC1 family protein